MITQTTAETDIAVVRSGFEAMARGDVAGFSELFHDDATWNHRNEDPLGGMHQGRDGIVTFITESVQLTAGTLRPVPLNIMADGAGRAMALMRVSATRLDGRSFDDLEVLLFVIEGDRVRSVDQFVGEPAAVTAFWA